MSDLLNVLNSFGFNNHKQLWLAYSGGLDSCVLLHALCQLPEIKRKLYVIHINHNLHDDSLTWQQHCQTVCDLLLVPLVIRSLTPSLLKNKSNIEELARNARYKIFEELISESDALLLGHHQQDQAETFLLRLFRGAGIDGLSAMKPITKRNKLTLLRPFLDVEKKTLTTYAAKNNLSWVEDPSNLNSAFHRNFIRNHIMPLIKERYPNVDKNIARSAALCQETQTHIEISNNEKFRQCLNKNSTFKLDLLLTFTKTEQKILLRQWLLTYNTTMPSQAQLQNFIDNLNSAKNDKHPLLCIGQSKIQVHKNALYFYKECPIKNIETPYIWQQPFSPIKRDMFEDYLNLVPMLNKANIHIPLYSKIEVRYRKGGEKIQLNGIHQKVKKILNQLAMPNWLKPHLPLIYINGQLASIGADIIADPYNLKDKNNHYLYVSKL